MRRPSFYRECKPFSITQSWGIYNPAYLQFGYSKHNGTDYNRGKYESEYPLHWGLDNCEVYFSGYEENTGWCVKANSLDLYDFDDGKQAKINLILMHMKEQPMVKVGQILHVGDYVGLADNSGFSTGTHTHRNGRRVDTNFNKIDKNDASDSFDTMVYDSGYHAQDYGVIVLTLQTLLSTLQALVGALSPKKTL
jgi:hypothetical protein